MALGMSVRRAQEEIDVDEFRNWLAYERIEPFGPRRQELMLAQLCSLTFNINRGKGVPASKVEDWMPEFRAVRKQSQQEIKHRLDLFFSVYEQHQEARK